jgi:D-alanyl-D-alanine carboxypeptidase
MTALRKFVETIVDQGAREARKDGSATIQAQHLLLAIAAEEDGAAHQVLTSVGLDHRAIREALDREFEQSLGAAGVSLATGDLPRPSSDPGRPSHLGATAKLALERGVKSGVRKDLQSAQLLLGILQAQVGTVPRALALAAVDQADLTVRVLRALENDGG